MEPAGPARVERRLAAILAADVAGYSRLIGADEEGTLARLRALRARADRSEDRRAQGPHRQDHRRRPPGRVRQRRRRVALRSRGAARQWPNAMPRCPAEQRIVFRIGIHLGDIVVEDGDIFGDGVNVAARLEGLAEPGGICVSARVQEDAAASSISRSRISASRHSKISLGRCGRTACRDTAATALPLTPATAGRCRSPTSRRSRSCHSRT